jgi:hypothetical protein
MRPAFYERESSLTSSHSILPPQASPSTCSTRAAAS